MNINLDIKTEELEGETVLTLIGEIDAYTAPILKEQLLPLTARQDHLITVNLESVDYMDSTGLGVFISALKATKEHDSKLKLVNLQDRVHRLFKITSLDTIISIDTIVRGGN